MNRTQRRASTCVHQVIQRGLVVFKCEEPASRERGNGFLCDEHQSEVFREALKGEGDWDVDY
jgi:hypothetical protein